MLENECEVMMEEDIKVQIFRDAVGLMAAGHFTYGRMAVSQVRQAAMAAGLIQDGKQAPVQEILQCIERARRVKDFPDQLLEILDEVEALLQAD